MKVHLLTYRPLYQQFTDRKIHLTKVGQKKFNKKSNRRSFSGEEENELERKTCSHGQLTGARTL